jgi:hypothetical protein
MPPQYQKSSGIMNYKNDILVADYLAAMVEIIEAECESIRTETGIYYTQDEVIKTFYAIIEVIKRIQAELGGNNE